MADAELKVRIEAEIQSFKNNMQSATNEAETAGNKITQSVNNLNKSFSILNNTKFTFGQNYTSASKAVANEAAKTSNILGGSFQKASNQAAFALTNLGRVAQDAPFGFIGIQNNLNPLLESFQALKRETGSTGSALKALAGSLIGAGGVGLALSAVTALLTFSQIGLSAWVGKAKKAKDETKSYADSLNQLTRSQLVGAQSATQEATQLSLLFKQYQNNSLTLAQRKSAYDEIQRLYPSYFGNIKFEQNASAKTKEAYDRLTSSIIATGRARAAADLITKNSQRQLENEQKLIDLGIEFTNQQIIANKALRLARSGGGELGEAKALADFTNAQKEQRSIQQQINNLVTDSVLLRGKNLQLEQSVTSEIEKGGSLFEKNTKAQGLKTIAEILKTLNIDLKQAEASIDGTFGDKSKEKVKAYAKAIDDLISIGIKPTDSVIKGLQDQLLKVQSNEIKQTGKSVGITLSSGISEGFATTLPVVGIDLSTKLKTGLTDWQTYVNSELLPKVQGNFETFFNDILMRGKLSFESLSKAVLNTFISIIASDAARGITNLLSANTGRQYSDSLGKGKGGGLLGGIVGLFGSTKNNNGESAKKGIGGLLGTIIPAAGLAFGAISVLGGLFKKRTPEPQPAYTTYSNVSSAPVSNSGLDYGRVVFEISGVNLVGVLNRAGAKLQRFGP